MTNKSVMTFISVNKISVCLSVPTLAERLVFAGESSFIWERQVTVASQR